MLGDAVFLPSVSQAAQAALATASAGRTPRRARWAASEPVLSTEVVVQAGEPGPDIS
jgi:hypothetical protein